MPEPSAGDADPGKPVQPPKSSLPFIESTDVRLAAAQARLSASKRGRRVMKGLYCGCLVVIAHAAFWPGLQQASRGRIAAADAVIAFFLLIPYMFASTLFTSEEQEVAVLAARKALLNRQATDRDTGKGSINYFDRLVDINLNNLADYYLLIKTQANNGFSASVLAGAFGFFLIIAGLAYGLFDKAGSHLVTYVGAASGVVTEFIAAVFFYLFNRTVRQMKSYHENLLTIQNILLAFKIVDETQNDSERTAMMKEVFGYLLGKSTALRIPEGGGKTTE
jgi:hypothetical protein